MHSTIKGVQCLYCMCVRCVCVCVCACARVCVRAFTWVCACTIIHTSVQGKTQLVRITGPSDTQAESVRDDGGDEKSDGRRRSINTSQGCD